MLQVLCALVLVAVLYTARSPNSSLEATIGLSAIFIFALLMLGPWWPRKDKDITDGIFLTPRAAKRLALGAGLIAFVMALLQVIAPRVPDASGRWSWLIRPIYDNFGNFGLGVLWLLVGLVLVAPSLWRST